MGALLDSTLIHALHEAAVRSGPAGPTLTGVALLVAGGYLLVRRARRRAR